MQSLLTWLENLSQQIPITYFVIIGGLVEELIALVPSPLVMLLTGSLAAAQNQPPLFLLFLILLGSFSKTLATLILYFIADKAEDLFIPRFGKYFGISRKELEELGKFISKGKRDDLMLFLLRALPIMPTAPVTVIAGILKTNLRTYVISTFLGLSVRNAIYLYLGYAGLGTIQSLSQDLDSLETIGYLILSVGAGVAFLWLYRQRQKSSPLEQLRSLFSRLKRN